ncbi:hypothetical protein BN903_152 [Halorubrum sp. AJ67]|nr:hypothetical protein BN903_152 [Halorubrum sp. AJ67]
MRASYSLNASRRYWFLRIRENLGSFFTELGEARSAMRDSSPCRDHQSLREDVPLATSVVDAVREQPDERAD